MISTPRKISDISIIIPTLNEAENLPALQPLIHIAAECIVVDGGSTDNTVQIAKELGFRVKECAGGRGKQLNFGASLASSPVLLFLHADTLLPAGFHEAVITCLHTPDTVLGAFRLAVKDSGFPLRFICRLANVRSQLLQLPYGDQALFLRRGTFAQLGGFAEQPIMEDYIFVKQAKKLGRVVTVQEEVTTSGRRWMRLGVFRTTLFNQLVILGYYLGIPAEKLALFYRRGFFFGKFGGNKGTHHIF